VLFPDEFFQIFNHNQITVMVGETGSGKTTQYVTMAKARARADQLSPEYRNTQSIPIFHTFAASKLHVRNQEE
jgi:ABC-type phosphonate transport system ATPase subunit